MEVLGDGQGEEEKEKEEWMKRRVVQTGWRRLEGEERREERDEGRDAGRDDGTGWKGDILPAWAEWVVDPRWPELEEEVEDEQEGGRV